MTDTGEDPEDKTVREAHGFTLEDRYTDLSLMCRNGCGISYYEAVAGKVTVCRRST